MVIIMAEVKTLFRRDHRCELYIFLVGIGKHENIPANVEALCRIKRLSCLFRALCRVCVPVRNPRQRGVESLRSGDVHADERDVRVVSDDHVDNISAPPHSDGRY